MLKTIKRAGPARLVVKSVAYGATTAYQGTVSGQAIFTQIADDTGRVVYTALGETTLGRASAAKLTQAKVKATLFAALLAQAKPNHWLESGHLTFGVDEPGMGLAAIGTINADDWILQAPYMVIKTATGHAIPGPIEVAYPMSLAHLSDREPRVSEINRDIFSACVRSGFYRELTGAEAIEHSDLMPA
jgi:hypothetical protein